MMVIDVAEQYLTLAEVAQRLRMSEATVRRWVRTGQLPAEKVGLAPSFRYRVARSELERFCTR
jgi:excisionase family DNA binding protein